MKSCNLAILLDAHGSEAPSERARDSGCEDHERLGGRGDCSQLSSPSPPDRIRSEDFYQARPRRQLGLRHAARNARHAAGVLAGACPILLVAHDECSRALCWGCAESPLLADACPRMHRPLGPPCKGPAFGSVKDSTTSAEQRRLTSRSATEISTAAIGRAAHKSDDRSGAAGSR